MAFLTPALAFNDEPYHANNRGNTLLKFREQGFAVASGVFQPDTVDAFREQLESLITRARPPSTADTPTPAWFT